MLTTVQAAKKRNNISIIVDNRLCTGCGGCAGICPEKAIEMIYTPQGTLVPLILQKGCTSCGMCLRICSGCGINIPEFQKRIFGESPHHPEIGNFVQIYAGYSENEKNRYHCQSGGLISALLIHLLKNKQIDGAIVTRWKKDNPVSPEAFIARNVKEILEAAKSKYNSVPVASSISDILETEGRYVFVGVSCQIHVMRKAEEINHALRDRIFAYFGLHCLSVFSNDFISYTLRRNSISQDIVSSFEYRSKEWRGWPGDMRIELNSGKAVNISGLISRLIPRPYFTPLRCIYCVDKLNELSDISFGDCRIARVYGHKRIRRAHYNLNSGKSDIICRSKKGYAIIEGAQGKKVIHIEPTSWKEILRTTKVSEKKLALTHFKFHSRIFRINLPDYGFISYPKKETQRLVFRFLQPISMISSVFFRLMERIREKSVVMMTLKVCPNVMLLLVSQLRERMTNYNIFSRSELDVHISTGNTSKTKSRL